LRLLRDGFVVIGVGRHEGTLRGTLALAGSLGDKFRIRVADVRKPPDVETIVNELAESFGRLDVLVNNAGGQYLAPAVEISDRGWAAVIDLNLTAVFTIVRRAYHVLKKARGTVITISISGVERGSRGMAHSVAARSGVVGLTKTLALEWARDGISLNAIAPGIVTTSGLDHELAMKSTKNLLRAIPMRRFTSPEDVADLVAFFTGQSSKLITGQVIYLDGGAHIGPGLHFA
jgi:citronellol/citronellal dehydrogenase